jgi:hypothetical protein
MAMLGGNTPYYQKDKFYFLKGKLFMKKIRILLAFFVFLVADSVFSQEIESTKTNDELYEEWMEWVLEADGIDEFNKRYDQFYDMWKGYKSTRREEMRAIAADRAANRAIGQNDDWDDFWEDD